MAKPKPKKFDPNEREKFAAAQGVLSGLIQVTRKSIENYSDIERRLNLLAGTYDDFIEGSDKILIKDWIKQITKDRKTLLTLEHEASEMIETMPKPK